MNGRNIHSEYNILFITGIAYLKQEKTSKQTEEVDCSEVLTIVDAKLSNVL